MRPLPDLARQRRLAAGRLSGGQRQMLAIARALMIRAEAASCSTSPQPGCRRLVAQRVRQAREKSTARASPSCWCEQNARAALAVGDRAYVLAEGQNRHEGTAATSGTIRWSPGSISGGMAAARGRSANP